MHYNLKPKIMRQTKEQTIGPVSEFLKESKFQYEYSEGKTDYYTSNNFRRFLLCHVNKPLAEDSPNIIIIDAKKGILPCDSTLPTTDNTVFQGRITTEQLKQVFELLKL